MNLYESIINYYPELINTQSLGMFDPFANGTIVLRDDSDGAGAYIEKWNYNKPIPEGLTLGKPSA
jgi:hypothetical protein